MQVLIQPNVFREEEIPLKKYLRENGIKFTHYLSEVDLTQAVFIRGTPEFCANFYDAYGCIHNNIVGRFKLEDYSCSNYYHNFGNEMLNSDFILMPFGCVKYNQEILFKAFDNQCFVRPDSGIKIFTGGVYNLLSIKYIPNCLADDLILVSSNKYIEHEYRCLVINDELVDIVEYGEKIGGVDKKVWSYALDIFERFPESSYALDICKTNGGFKVVEVNALSSSGWYDCNLDKVWSKVLCL